MDLQKAEARITRMWRDSITDALVDYIRIPAKSPHFDADWDRNGYIDDAVEHIAGWCREQPLSR